MATTPEERQAATNWLRSGATQEKESLIEQVGGLRDAGLSGQRLRDRMRRDNPTLAPNTIDAALRHSKTVRELRRELGRRPLTSVPERLKRVAGVIDYGQQQTVGTRYRRWIAQVEIENPETGETISEIIRLRMPQGAGEDDRQLALAAALAAMYADAESPARAAMFQALITGRFNFYQEF